MSCGSQSSSSVPSSQGSSDSFTPSEDSSTTVRCRAGSVGGWYVQTSPLRTQILLRRRALGLVEFRDGRLRLLRGVARAYRLAPGCLRQPGRDRDPVCFRGALGEVQGPAVQRKSDLTCCHTFYRTSAPVAGRGAAVRTSANAPRTGKRPPPSSSSTPSPPRGSGAAGPPGPAATGRAPAG